MTAASAEAFPLRPWIILMTGGALKSTMKACRWVGQMYEIEMPEVSQEFVRCGQAAGRYLQQQLQGSVHQWLKADLNPPFLEHLSFYLRTELFFIRLRDVDGGLTMPGSDSGLLRIADGSNGHPCIMPMRHEHGGWAPAVSGWGLLDARTGLAVDPAALLNNERVEISDWELHDLAVNYVRAHLEKAGRKLIARQTDPGVHPSIWFVGDSGPEWVVVRAVRYPRLHAAPPDLARWREMSEANSRLGKVGYFASVSVINSDETFEPNAAALPLWRGFGMFARFDGLVSPYSLEQA